MAKKWTLARAFPLMLVGAVAIGAVSVGVSGYLRRANTIAQSTAAVQAAALTGDPCPTLTKDEYVARGSKAKQVFITNDIRYERRFGHVDCSIIEGGRSGNDYVPVCQFSGPALLVVTTSKGSYYFAPGAGRPATVATHDGVPGCVLPKIAGAQLS